MRKLVYVLDKLVYVLDKLVHVLDKLVHVLDKQVNMIENIKSSRQTKCDRGPNVGEGLSA